MSQRQRAHTYGTSERRKSTSRPGSGSENAPQAGYQAANVEPGKLHRRIAGAVREYLSACIGDLPAVVVAEDMHWFDKDTTEVVKSLISEASGRLLVVMTSREDASLPDGKDISRFTLKPLTDSETDELVAALYPELSVEGRHVSVNIDPSDRYVQSVPGSDRYRLRPDESGYDNLVLAGDWTDCGMNAGCIEAAVRSGLQAANVLLGGGRHHGNRGYYLP
jgi:hypothetical protein